MKAEVFVQALNEVDDKYIEEAVNYRPVSGHLRIWKVVAIAACACLAVSMVFSVVGLQMMDSGRNSTATSSDRYYGKTADTGAYLSQDVLYEAAAEDMPLYAEETFSDYEMAEESAFMADASMNQSAPGGILGSASAIQPGTAAEETMQPKIIYNVYMDVQTTAFDDAVDQLDQLIESSGGYSENQYVAANMGSLRNASYTVRVPAGKLEAFLEEMKGIGIISYMNRSADDVSENYYDIQSRLTSAKAKLDRLNQLLGEAEDMEDIISIEEAISNVQWEIDSYTGSLKYYDSRVEYSTVTVNLAEVEETIVEEAPLTFGGKIGLAFSQGIRGFTTFLKNLVIWISASWIWLILIAVLVFAAVFLIRKIRKGHRRNR
ncbi:MAG: DUF4349 domain-containing protein [Parasporobacterium sp.]|nr:DUF4349 domain-containing protein [Parasporobacterium sp.]